MTVYLIRSIGNRAVKIGFTDGDPAKRLKALQTGSPSKLELLSVIPGPRSLEKKLHGRFAHLRRRAAGEWFSDDPVIRAAFLELEERTRIANLKKDIDLAVQMLETAGSLTALSEVSEAVTRACAVLAHAPTRTESVAPAPGSIERFWLEFRDQFVWDLLPFPFLYDLYTAWYDRIPTSGSPVSRQRFVGEIERVIRGDGQWHCRNKSLSIRPGSKMNGSEPLIAEYGLTAWPKPTRKAIYRGILRHALASMTPAGPTDDAESED